MLSLFFLSGIFYAVYVSYAPKSPIIHMNPKNIFQESHLLNALTVCNHIMVYLSKSHDTQRIVSNYSIMYWHSLCH